MSNPCHIYTADGDLRIKCCNCRGQIRDGQEYVVEMFPHGSRIDYYHFECPKLDDHADRAAKPMKTQARR